MARMRSIKPEFFLDRKLARNTSRDARLLYAGLWTQADEHARLNGDVRVIKGNLLPYDEDATDDAIECWLKELETHGGVVSYEVDGDPYLFLPKLAKHQKLDTAKQASRHPDPPQRLKQNSPADVGGSFDRDSDDISMSGEAQVVGGADQRSQDAAPDASESRPDKSEKNPDQSAPDQEPPGQVGAKHVACSKEHVAGLRPSDESGRDPKRATRIPADWRPPDELRTWTLEQGLTADEARDQLARFVDFWTAKSGKDATKLSWDATWRNWVRTHLDRRPKTPATTTKAAKPTCRSCRTPIKLREGSWFSMNGNSPLCAQSNERGDGPHEPTS